MLEHVICLSDVSLTQRGSIQRGLGGRGGVGWGGFDCNCVLYLLVKYTYKERYIDG